MKDREKSLATVYAIIALDGCILEQSMPYWARWVAMDSNGVWFAYRVKPELRKKTGQWSLENLQHGVTFLRLSANSRIRDSEPSKLYKI